MADRLIGAADLPKIDADADTVSRAARSLREATGDIARGSSAAELAWSGIGGVLDSPGATDRLPNALDALDGQTTALAHAALAVAGALETFADDLTTLKRSGKMLLADIEELRSRVAAKSHDGDVPAEYEAQNDELHVHAARLATRWQSAQDDLAQALQRHTAAGPLTGPMLATGFSAPPPPPLVDFRAVVRGFEGAARLPLLAQLAAKGHGAVERWLQDHPAERQQLSQNPPKATAVRRWWDGLSATERTALVLGASTLIGNLDGVRYADRGRANRHTLDVELPKARSR